MPHAALEGEWRLVNSRESSPDLHAYLRRLFAKWGVQPELVEPIGAPRYSFTGVMWLVAEGEGAFLSNRTLTAVPRGAWPSGPRLSVRPRGLYSSACSRR